jgi:HEAT repeat protein
MLQRALEDPHYRIRKAAIFALAALQQHKEEAKRAIQSLQRDPSPDVRLARNKALKLTKTTTTTMP